MYIVRLIAVVRPDYMLWAHGMSDIMLVKKIVCVLYCMRVASFRILKSIYEFKKNQNLMYTFFLHIFKASLFAHLFPPVILCWMPI